MIILKKIKFFFVIVAVIFNVSLLLANEKNFKIIRLVNDQVITNYDLEQRLQLFSILNKVQINNENFKQYAKIILSNMVDEKLQLEQINQYNIFISDTEVKNYIQRVYLNENEKINDFYNLLKKDNIQINILEESIRIQLGWNNLAGKLYYRTSKINDSDLSDKLKQEPSLSKEQAENILLQKQISLRANKLLRDIKAEANIEIR